MSKVSVIIRCRNEERWVGHAIQSALDFFKNPEVIVLDNKSQDDSKLIVRQFSSFDNVRLLDVDDYTPGRALNIGAKEAKNDIVLFLSAHCVLTKCDVEKVKELLKKHRAVFGKQVPIYHGKKITPRYLWSNFHDEEAVNHFSESEGRHFLHNGMCFYDRKFLLENPFDEKLAGKEDRYWARDVVERGHTYIYAPQIVECHHHWTPNGNTWKGIG